MRGTIERGLDVTLSPLVNAFADANATVQAFGEKRGALVKTQLRENFWLMSR